MKTIKEAAEEYAGFNKIGIVNDRIRAFKAGVEFAQRWISVKDELPEEGVLVQVKYIHPAGVQYTHDYIEEDIDDESGKHFKAWHDDYGSTHWRPIELK